MWFRLLARSRNLGQTFLDNSVYANFVAQSVLTSINVPTSRYVSKRTFFLHHTPGCTTDYLPTSSDSMSFSMSAPPGQRLNTVSVSQVRGGAPEETVMITALTTGRFIGLFPPNPIHSLSPLFLFREKWGPVKSIHFLLNYQDVPAVFCDWSKEAT